MLGQLQARPLALPAVHAQAEVSLQEVALHGDRIGSTVPAGRHPSFLFEARSARRAPLLDIYVPDREWLRFVGGQMRGEVCRVP